MLAYLRRVVRVAALLALIGPLLVPGINLAELAITGTTDDAAEFCDAAAPPRLVQGTTWPCQMDMRQITLYVLLAYIGAFILVLPLAVLLQFLWIARRRPQGSTPT
jgi:hypothetical protein